jgi:hypothetical protein
MLRLTVGSAEVAPVAPVAAGRGLAGRGLDPVARPAASAASGTRTTAAATAASAANLVHREVIPARLIGRAVTQKL